MCHGRAINQVAGPISYNLGAILHKCGMCVILVGFLTCPEFDITMFKPTKITVYFEVLELPKRRGQVWNLHGFRGLYCIVIGMWFSNTYRGVVSESCFV